MNRILWKCCGKTFRDITKYTDHFLIVHTKNADYKGTDATNSNDRTTLLSVSADSGSKQIRVTKNTTGMNEYKKDISVVDSNDSDRIIETPTKKECKENFALVDSIRRSTDSNKSTTPIQVNTSNPYDKTSKVVHKSVSIPDVVAIIEAINSTDQCLKADARIAEYIAAILLLNFERTEDQINYKMDLLSIQEEVGLKFSTIKQE
ncbi:hypothetical protein NPIL_598961 [Nephila pilipes]|uniref:Uncharacterized protein n=1 Tax=Nephila pilipes TaxID=299642 RepID=A0A8X6PMJ7_NEPPI|nr:hypothetical protein NPIL_598961 [Nephila pilipes]